MGIQNFNPSPGFPPFRLADGEQAKIVIDCDADPSLSVRHQTTDGARCMGPGCQLCAARVPIRARAGIAVLTRGPDGSPAWFRWYCSPSVVKAVKAITPAAGKVELLVSRDGDGLETIYTVTRLRAESATVPDRESANSSEFMQQQRKTPPAGAGAGPGAPAQGATLPDGWLS